MAQVIETERLRALHDQHKFLGFGMVQRLQALERRAILPDGYEPPPPEAA